ncbi:DUF1648 domain-containing protein [Thermogemmatispora tikiterensis]|uniref:DUF1648 domain-containing protein n=1 Tax=Thermogemmatispora tikiterensis TaxID=1825093 RepID=A0A328VDD2_9CHLR|nr:DUF1648 domain-containing protein [Thermogemmatispora tikiterensis]RAQ95696.1 hypothetical protein A4R35_09135 [Thermogemmatispora tikiterensis]
MNALYTCINVLMLIWIVMICWLWPDLALPTLPFGVRVPPTHVHEAVIAQSRRRYHLVLLLTGLAGLLVLLLVAFFLPLWGQIWAMLGVLLGTVVIAAISYALLNLRLRRIKEQEGWYAGLRQAVAVEVGVSEQRGWPSPFWLGLDLLLLVALWVVTVVRYPVLPERIPLHFGPDGQVNRWGGKQELLLFSLLALALNILLLGLALALPLGSRQLDPADPEQARRDRQRRQQALRNLLASVLGIVNLCFLLILLLLTQIVPPTNLNVMLMVVLLLILLLGLGGLMVFYLIRARPSQAYALRTNYVARDDDRYWKGGLVYINRDDPALFVERRLGMGWTLNLGHPLGIALMLVILLVVVAALLLGLLAGQR